jgi:hypothetical protein
MPEVIGWTDWGLEMFRAASVRGEILIDHLWLFDVAFVVSVH